MALPVLAQSTARDAPAEGPAYELWFRLEAELRGRKLDADLRAGGRLLMRGEPGPDGGLVLRLEQVLEPPWKFYWVDPAGPFGEEVKLAAVVDLPEASWEALEEAREYGREIGAREYARWRAGDPRKPGFDGAFAFVVLGPAQERFAAELGADGELRAVENRLTDRWQSGPFDRWIGAWGPEAPAASPAGDARPWGYWFWNDGEPEAFTYEPHTYHALAEALRLLAAPVPAAREPLVWRRPAALAESVLETLAPKTRRGRARPGPESLSLRPAPTAGGARRWRAEWRGDRATLVAERRRADGEEPAGDLARLELRDGADRLVLEVGYRRLED